jgi:hypothetical protein
MTDLLYGFVVNGTGKRLSGTRHRKGLPTCLDPFFPLIAVLPLAALSPMPIATALVLLAVGASPTRLLRATPWTARSQGATGKPGHAAALVAIEADAAATNLVVFAVASPPSKLGAGRPSDRE